MGQFWEPIEKKEDVSASPQQTKPQNPTSQYLTTGGQGGLPPTTPVVKEPEKPKKKDVAGSTNKTSPKKPEPVAAKPEPQNQSKQSPSSEAPASGGGGSWNQFIFEDPSSNNFGNFAKITISVNQTITMNFQTALFSAFTSTGLDGCKIELPLDSSQTMSDSVSVSWARKSDSTTVTQAVEYMTNTDTVNRGTQALESIGISGMSGDSIRRFMTEDYNMGSLIKSIDVPFVIWQNKSMTPTKIKEGLGLLQGLIYPGLIGFMYPPSLTLSVGNLYRKMKANLASVDLQFDDGWRSLNPGSSGIQLNDDAFPMIIRGKLRFVNLFMYMWDALTEELTLKGKPWILFGDEKEAPSSGSSNNGGGSSSSNAPDDKKLGTPSDKNGSPLGNAMPPMGLPTDGNMGLTAMNPNMLPGDANFGNTGIGGAMSGMTGIGGLGENPLGGVFEGGNVGGMLGTSGINPFGEGNDPFMNGMGGINGILEGGMNSTWDFANAVQGGGMLNGMMNMDMSSMASIQGNLPNMMNMSGGLGSLMPSSLGNIGGNFNIGSLGQMSSFGNSGDILKNVMGNLDSKISSLGGLDKFTSNLQNSGSLPSLNKLSSDNAIMMANTLQMRQDLSKVSGVLKDLSNNTLLKSTPTSSIINSLNGGLENVVGLIDNIKDGKSPVNPSEVKRLLGGTLAASNSSVNTLDKVGSVIGQTCEKVQENKGLAPAAVIKNGIVSSLMNGSVAKDTKQIVSALKGISTILENSKEQIASNKEEKFVCQQIADTVKRNASKIETKATLVESQSNNILKRSSELFRKGLGE